MGSRGTGVVAKMMEGKSFGFVLPDGADKRSGNIFFHFTELRDPDKDWDWVKVGARVEFTMKVKWEEKSTEGRSLCVFRFYCCLLCFPL